MLFLLPTKCKRASERRATCGERAFLTCHGVRFDSKFSQGSRIVGFGRAARYGDFLEENADGRRLSSRRALSRSGKSIRRAVDV